mgnify:CR=1 FL=1
MSKHQRNDKIIIDLLSGQTLTKHEQEEAGRILCEAYIPMVEAYLRGPKFGISGQLLIDRIIIETIDRVTASIKKYDLSRSKLTSFMIGFAKNIAHEMLRKELTTIGLEGISTEHVLETYVSSTEEGSILKDLLHGRYAECFESLDTKYKELIQIELEGMSPEIYMKKYKVNRPAYRKRKERGLKELREIISMMGPNTRQS